MPLPGFSRRRRELGALPDLTRQRGPSAPAASGARAGRAPGPRPARGARPRLRGPRTLSFVVFGVLLPVQAASAMVTQQDKCPPGSRVSEDNKNCTLCTNGVDFTSHRNSVSSCLPCSTCKSDEEQIAPCTRTENTRCQCKRGTFHGEDSPEVCQKCSTRCPDGMVEASPCTAWSDLKCVHQESGNPWLVMGIVVGAVGVVLLLVVTAYYYRKRVLQGCGVDAKCMNRVFFWRSCPPRGPGALDNTYNEILNNRGSPSTLASEQELEDEELTGVSTQSPGEAEHLLGPAGAEGSQMRRRLLVPANGADPTESLRLFFNYFPRIVSINSWNMLMRQMGLTDNEIHVSRARALDPGDALYEMLVTWLDKTGRGASVNTLLDALETLGERYAKETIQDHLVGSGKFVYEEGLRLFFNYFPRIVSINSWNMLMRQMGLTDNEIHVSRAQALDPGDALYEMLVTWLDKTGRSASVNTLLDALETLGERYAKETIQDHLVGSGKYIYEEGGAGSTVS